MNPGSFVIRNYSRDDFQKIEEIAKSFCPDEMEGRKRASSILEKIEGRPFYTPEKDIFVVEGNQAVAGFGDVTSELKISRVILDVFVYPRFRRKGLASELMNRSLKRGGQLGARQGHVRLLEESEAGKCFLLEQGFNRVRCFLELEANLKEISALELERMPENMGTFGDGDEALLAKIQNSFFSGSWGFCPNTVDEIKYYITLTDSKMKDILWIKHGTRITGYLWPHSLSDKEAPARKKAKRIHMFGIDPEFRGRGLGKKLLVAGLCYLKNKGAETVELTADEKNASAISLYKSLGFRVKKKTFWYEKKLFEYA